MRQKKILEKINLSGEFTVLNLRPWTHEDEFLNKIRETLEVYLKNNKVLLLPMHLSQDIGILRKLEEDLNSPNLYSVYEEMSVRTLMGIIKYASVVISMRLHGLIYSVSVGTKPLALSYDPKVDSFMKEINSKYILNINNFNSDLLLKLLIEIKEDSFYLNNINKDEIERETKARLNAKEVLDILGDLNEKD